jgi:hypothetical protein
MVLVADDQEHRPLLESRDFLPLRYVSKQTGVPVERIEALIRAGLLGDALFGKDGAPLHLWEDSVPSGDQLRSLLSQMDEKGSA